MRSRECKDGGLPRRPDPVFPAALIALDEDAANDLEFIVRESEHARPGRRYSQAEIVSSLLKMCALVVAGEITFTVAEDVP